MNIIHYAFRWIVFKVGDTKCTSTFPYFSSDREEPKIDLNEVDYAKTFLQKGDIVLHDASRNERHRFSRRIRALWRRMNGWFEETEPLVDGLTLSDAPAGLALRIVQVLGGGQRMRRLLEIGICPGAQIEIAASGRYRPVIVKVGETRLAIGRNIAVSVIVEILPPA